MEEETEARSVVEEEIQEELTNPRVEMITDLAEVVKGQERMEEYIYFLPYRSLDANYPIFAHIKNRGKGGNDRRGNKKVSGEDLDKQMATYWGDNKKESTYLKLIYRKS